MKEKMKAAQAALIEAKSAYEAEPSEATLTALESKAAEFTDLQAMAQRASTALGMKALALDGDVADESSARLQGSLVQKFIETPQYKSLSALGAAASNSAQAISLPAVKLGSYAEVMESKAALTSGIAHPQAVRFPMIDATIPPELTLFDLVHKGTIDAQSLQYVQITAVTRNAALQPENTGDKATDTLKPLSDMATKLETAQVFGYADGYVMTTQMLADAGAFASYMDGQLRTSIRAVQEDMLLNGSGSNGQPRGVLNTTGLQGQEYDGSGATPIKAFAHSIRTAMRKVSKAGGSTSAILVNPEDNEELDLWQDTNGVYYFGGPASTGVQTLWGRPRVVSEKIEKGTALLGDFNTISYLDRDGISVEAFNQHEDFARRNLVYVRGEARGLQVIWRPAHLALVTKKGA